MIFAEIEYREHYSELHDELLDFLAKEFKSIESGLQGDSWIWIFEGEVKVAIDTFTSMQHQIKSSSPKNVLVQKVIKYLRSKYSVRVYCEPEYEAHEE